MNKMIVFTVMFAVTLFADPVVRTGQTSSYGQASNNPVSRCTVKDDGCYRAGEEFDYDRNNKGIVTDHVTNLEWDDTSIKIKSWYDSRSYCNGSTLDGGGWRVPTIKELETLVNYTKISNAVDDIFEKKPAGNYWSSNEYVGDSSKGWIVRFQSWGYSLEENKTNDVVTTKDPETNATSTTYYYVRCVRGKGYGDPDLHRSNNIVTDRANGLEWQDDANAKNIKKNWIGAINYCENLKLGKFADGTDMDDWRLPNQKELLTIADRTKYDPAIDKSAFQNYAPNAYRTSARYWSSTTRKINDPDRIHAWFVHFGRGINYYNDKNNSNYYVRCVRENIFPTADAGLDQNVDEGDAVTLDGSGSSDPDGTVASYLWEENNTPLGNDKTFAKSDFSIGTHMITLTVTDDDGATDSNTTVVKVKDITPPVITLKGANPMNVDQDDTFSDPGASATDNVDGSVAVSTSGTVDTSKVGSYTLTYTATDAAGNKATKTRVVNVLDTTPPVITLKGANPMSIVQGSTFIDPGATAADNVDGTVSVTESGTVDTSTIGSYIRTYTATDAAGNKATKTRVVNVTAAPVSPPTLPAWIDVKDDGKTVTYSAAGNDSAVVIDSALQGGLDISANDDRIILTAINAKTVGNCEIRPFVLMQSNGTVSAGYTHKGSGCGDDLNTFAAGTQVTVDSDIELRIDTPLISDLVLGGK